jgi:hypothetical protein
MVRKYPIPVNEPDEAYKNELHKIYEVIFDSDIGENKKKLMTYLFAWRNWSWRVVGISESAINHIKVQDYSDFAKGLVRDHFVQDRDKTYSKMLSVNSRLDFDEWWNLFWQNDRTIILTKDEHNKSENYRKKLLCFRLNWSDGYFSCNPLIGFKCRKTIEGEFIKNLVEGDKILSDHRKLCTQQQIQELSQ